MHILRKTTLNFSIALVIGIFGFGINAFADTYNQYVEVDSDGSCGTNGTPATWDAIMGDTFSATYHQGADESEASLPLGTIESYTGGTWVSVVRSYLGFNDSSKPDDFDSATLNIYLGQITDDTASIYLDCYKSTYSALIDSSCEPTNSPMVDLVSHTTVSSLTPNAWNVITLDSTKFGAADSFGITCGIASDIDDIEPSHTDEDMSSVWFATSYSANDAYIEWSYTPVVAFPIAFGSGEVDGVLASLGVAFTGVFAFMVDGAVLWFTLIAALMVIYGFRKFIFMKSANSSFTKKDKAGIMANVNRQKGLQRLASNNRRRNERNILSKMKKGKRKTKAKKALKNMKW